MNFASLRLSGVPYGTPEVNRIKEAIHGFEYFLQQLVNGICLGGMYALMSVGYSLVYSIMNFSNFAHGGVIMVGAYVGYFALTSLNVPFFRRSCCAA